MISENEFVMFLEIDFRIARSISEHINFLLYSFISNRKYLFVTMAKETLSSTISLRQILQRHEEQLMDFDKNICLLCKRSFENNDRINRHRSLSKLHSSRLKRLRQRLFSDEQLDRIERKEREASYRDRAKERRLKYGQTDRIVPMEPVHQIPKESQSKKSRAVDVASKPLGLDNKGALLMTKMGWREGVGLGKSNEGITDIIKLESQVGKSGLGSKSYKVDPSLSYKDAVKQIMYQRYHEISSEDEA